MAVHRRTLEPAVPVFALHHERHPVVDDVHRGARWLSDDGARLDDLTIASHPAFPHAGERTKGAVYALNEKWLARALALPLPLEEAVDDDQAAPLANCVPKGRGVRDVFDARE